jgi:hypothetical protein
MQHLFFSTEPFKTERSVMANVLIFCTETDNRIASTIRIRLESIGHQANINQEKVFYGDQGDPQYFESVYHKDLLLFIWGTDSLSSENVWSEYNSAKRIPAYEGHIAHVRLSDYTIPDDITEAYLFRYEDPDLINKLDTVLKQISGADGFAGSENAQDPAFAETEFGSSSASAGDQAPVKAYWLLKIDPATWNLEQLKQGDEVVFSSYQENTEEKRRDYEQFALMKPDDELLVYAHEPNQEIMAIFKVTQSLHRNPSNNVEQVDFLIGELFSTAIPLENFQADIEFAGQLSASDPIVLFRLEQPLYTRLRGRQNQQANEEATYLDSFNNDISHEQTEDCLSFTDDYEALGRVILLEYINPPLAIGLFGNWGSGKSFFMEKLDNFIQRNKGTEKDFVKYVVSVKFNSWHYSDSNLWASLITDIFEALQEYGRVEKQAEQINKLSECLQVTLLQKAATQKRQQEIKAEVDQLTLQRDYQRQQLRDVSGLDLLRLTVSDKQVQQDLKKLDNDGIENILKEQQKVEGYIETFNSGMEQIRLFFKLITSFKSTRWILFISVAVLVFIGCLLVSSHWKPDWDALWSGAAAWYVLISGLIGKAVSAFKEKITIVKTINERLTSLKNTIGARAVKQPAGLTTAEQKLMSITDELAQLDKEITEKEQRLEDIFTGKKLSEFIIGRVQEQHYNQALGVVSWIRKDFEMLDHLLREQHQAGQNRKVAIPNPKEVTLQIDRIILYVDDLDRCDENVVSEVLKAINLLLAFPLFVVVVGVDPSWLDIALNTKHSALFNLKAKPEDKTIRKITTYDYLDKIFQVPFVIKPMEQSDRESLLTYLTQKERNAAGTSGGSDQGSDMPPPPGPDGPEDTGEAAAGPDESTDRDWAQDKEGPQNGAQAADNDPPPLPPTQRKVIFTKEELNFLKEISGLFGESPRMVNRYVNIYRIIKSHRKYQSAETPTWRDYKPTLISLGMIIGSPELAQHFIDMVYLAKEKLFLKALNEPEYQELKKHMLKQVKVEVLEELSINHFRRNLPLIARFSFRTHMIREEETEA